MKVASKKTSTNSWLSRAKLGLLVVVAVIVVAVAASTLPALANAPTPAVGADVRGGRIMLGDWTPGSTVHVTVDDDNNPANGTLASGDVTMSDGNWMEIDNLGGSNLQSILQTGQYVTASQGATTKTLQIAPLTVGGVDLASDTVTGTADPSAQLQVHVWNNSGGSDWSVNPTASPSGDWSADFTGIHTIVRGDNGGAMFWDSDGDWTEADFSVPNPNVWVVVASNELNVEEWPAGSTVHVVVDADNNPGNGVLFSSDVDVDSDGNGGMDNNWIAEQGGLHVGQFVTASEGSVTKVLQIGSLSVTAADTYSDTVSGMAAPNAPVEVWTEDKGGANGTANGSGAWSFHISDTDIVPGDHGMAAMADVDGDATRVNWTATGLTIKAASSKVKRGKTVTMSISGKPVDLGGEWVRVEVKKPGKSWALVTRIVIPRVGSWSCSYATTKSFKTGTYYFRAVYAGGWADLKGSTAQVKVTLTK